MNKRHLLSGILLTCLSFSGLCAGNIDICTGINAEAGMLKLKGIPILYDKEDFTVVEKVCEMLRDDLEKLTGAKAGYVESNDGTYIIVGTIGHSQKIDDLIKRKLLYVDDIVRQPERFKIKTIEDERGNQLLVVVGSDRRGTAYGVTSLSRELGVDPWVWWADVPVKQQPDISITADYTSEAPSIKYRGIFINDEDWGMLPWAAKGLDKDIHDIGPNTYEKVCQLLLRLKGNMLAPAMHSCTGAFYSHPESKKMADDYAIMITTSHCEPLLFNNAAKSEWDKERDGVWDYGLNKDVIYGKFSDRLDEAVQFENIYTIGMRGVHDEAMSKDRPIEEKIALLEQVIADQRDLLEKKTGKPANEIPQIFVPYKETLDLYRKGLEIPEDVMIIWPDDNYGYMKSLPSPEERERPGGSGVYYHTSYLGTPHDYLWLCTTPPAFMYSELKKAYDAGADRYWLLNVGDIKPAELDTQVFFDIAWNINEFDENNINTRQAEILAGWCGEQYKDDFQHILDEYYRLAWIRKPEYMGWEIEWDSPDRERLRPTEFCFSNYGDAVKRIDDYLEIALKTNDVLDSLPDSQRIPVFETIGYPVIASHLMNRKFLFAQLNGEYARAGAKEKANYAAFASRTAAEKLDSLTNRYNSLMDGKWNGMMSIPPGYCAKYQGMPPLKEFHETGSKAEWLTWDSDRSACRTLNLKEVRIPSHSKDSGTAILDGFGYDGYVLRLGDTAFDNSDNEALLDISDLKGDSITLQVFHLPYFPIYEGKGCKIGISIDGGEEKVIEYLPEEWSWQWKENVLRNSALSKVTLNINPELETHELRLRGIDPGMAIQRIVIDDGGFKPGYVGYDLQRGT